jgi:hypothetical protein
MANAPAVRHFHDDGRRHVQLRDIQQTGFHKQQVRIGKKEGKLFMPYGLRCIKWPLRPKPTLSS